MLPSMEEMMSVMSEPNVAPGSTPEVTDPMSNEMDLHAQILLDILKTVTRIEAIVTTHGTEQSAPEPVIFSPQLEGF